MSGAVALLAAALLLPLAAPVPLEAATHRLGEGFSLSLVDALCAVQTQLAQAASSLRSERPDLTPAEVAAFEEHLAASAPELRAACDKRVREAIALEDGPGPFYAARLRSALEKSLAPREFEQLRQFLDSPVGRHVESARRAVDAEAYLRAAPWARQLAPALYDELGMMLRVDVGPLPSKAEAPLPPQPVPGRARLRNAAALTGACESFYPLASRRAGEAGSVVLQVLVLANGRLGSVLVESSSGFAALDVAAAGCIGAMAQFEAPLHEGTPTAAWQRLRWTWKLSE